MIQSTSALEFPSKKNILLKKRKSEKVNIDMKRMSRKTPISIFMLLLIFIAIENKMTCEIFRFSSSCNKCKSLFRRFLETFLSFLEWVSLTQLKLCSSSRLWMVLFAKISSWMVELLLATIEASWQDRAEFPPEF